MKYESSLDNIGRTFGRLVVVEKVSRKGLHPRVLCRCTCGVIRSFDWWKVRTGWTKSCGCLQKERLVLGPLKNITHGKSHTSLYATWANMKDRCYNFRCHAYKGYGGRGIKIAPEWIRSFVTFYEYVRRVLGSRPSSRYSLDRIDNNGNYEPGNIRWATQLEQNQNRRTRKCLTKK